MTIAPGDEPLGQIPSPSPRTRGPAFVLTSILTTRAASIRTCLRRRSRAMRLSRRRVSIEADRLSTCALGTCGRLFAACGPCDRVDGTAALTVLVLLAAASSAEQVDTTTRPGAGAWPRGAT